MFISHQVNINTNKRNYNYNLLYTKEKNAPSTVWTLTSLSITEWHSSKGARVIIVATNYVPAPCQLWDMFGHLSVFQDKK